jgi:hypothetical protein
MPSIRIEMHYYTYAYLREDKTPYYIGKGKGNRIYDKRKTIKPPKDKSRIIFLKQNISEEEAFKHEIYMIAVFGRKDLGTGILRNRTNGGEGSSGIVTSQDTRKKLSNIWKGRKHTEETKKKMSENRKGKLLSEETKIKLSEMRKNPPKEVMDRLNRKGVSLTEEHKKKISDALKGRQFSEDHRKKLSKSAKKSSNDKSIV